MAKISDILQQSEGDFFTQKIKVDTYRGHSWTYCKSLCRDKTVLHVGCSDWPFEELSTNLHYHLYAEGICRKLVGVDPNSSSKLADAAPGLYVTHLQELFLDDNNTFDTVLVPNVLEHLKNPGFLISNLFEFICFKELFVLVPNYAISNQATYENGIFTEKIHPDHYAWYSPYTLLNLFGKQINEHNLDVEMCFFETDQMISIKLTNGK